VNIAAAESRVGLPVTTTVYTPATAVFLTLNEPDNEPLAENVHVTAVAIDDGVLDTQAYVPASLGLNPLPVTATEVPAGPEARLSEIATVVDVTVNGTEAESLVLPVTATVYVPDVDPTATWKDPNTEPPAEKVHVAAVTIDDGVLVTQG